MDLARKVPSRLPSVIGSATIHITKRITAPLTPMKTSSRNNLAAADWSSARRLLWIAALLLASFLNHATGAAPNDPTPTPTPVPATIYESNFKANTVQAFTLSGTSLGIFSTLASPTGVAVDGAGNIYVSSDTASGYSIQKYLPDGTNSLFATSGLKAPHGLAFDSSGNLYVANAQSSNVEKFTPDGTGTVFVDASAGLVTPVDVAFDSSGNLFVSSAYGGSTGTGSIVKVTPGGVATVFADGVFSTAYGIAIDKTDNIYVSNHTGNSILKFAPDGTNLGIFASTPLSGPYGMIFDADGNLYVANLATSTIEKFSSTGLYLGVFGSTGQGPHFLAISTQAASPTPTPTPALPTITTQPASKTVIVGRPASFSVKAIGPPPLTYQWRRDGVRVTHGAFSTYMIAATTAADNGAAFSVIVSNPFGSVTSDNAILTVRTPPTITTQPADITVSVGQTASFSVAVTGTTPFTYQWRKNGVNISGATNFSYTTPPTTAGDNRSRFSVFVTNSVGNTTSNDAILTVQ